MGQTSRINRASRFAKEFGPDFKERALFAQGTMLVIEEVLVFARDGDENVVTGYRVRRVDKPEEPAELLLEEGEHFDPEFKSRDDTIEDLCQILGLSEEQARSRMAKADL